MRSRRTRPSRPDVPTRLLDAAEAGFARQGFRATSIKAIGHAAGTNPALIYYYYRNKAGLYHAVLRRRFEGLGDAFAPALDPALSPEECIRRLVHGYVAFLRAHPALPPLMLREVLDHQAAHALAEVRRGAGAAIQGLLGVIARGQRTGMFRRDLVPSNVIVSILGQVIYAFIAQPVIQGVLVRGGPRAAGPWLDQFADHAAEFTLAALRPAAARRTSRRQRGT